MKAIFAVAAFTLAAFRFSLATSVSMTNAAATLSGTYSQDFNTLASSGSAPWENGVSLAGWQAQATRPVTNYIASSGSATASSLYSFGNTSDRAFGSIGGGDPDNFFWGIILRNDTGLIITNIALSFRGEQWRVANTTFQSVAFSYRVSDTQPAILTDPGYVRVTQIDFISPATNQSASACDGNATAYSQSLAHSWSVSIPPNAFLALRWSDPNHVGTDHGLAIDDLAVAWFGAEGSAPAPAIAIGRCGAREDFYDVTDGLPYGWRITTSATVRTTGSYGHAVLFVTAIDGTSLSASETGGSYSFSASGDANDRAIGGLSSSTKAKTVTLFARCRNATSSSICAWDVSYVIEKYRNGSNAAGFEILLLTSADGESWTAVPDSGYTFGADGANTGFDPAPEPVIPRTRALTVRTAPVPPNGVFYLAWRYSVATGATTSNAQALGIDDIFIKPVFPAGTVLVLR